MNTLASTRIAIVSFEGFDALDSFLLLGMLNRLRAQGCWAELCGPAHALTAQQGVTVTLQRPLEWANEAEVVVFGAGLYHRAIAENSALLDRLQLDPLRQLIGAHSSGVLLLARLGLLGEQPVCTDLISKPFVQEAGVRVLDDEAFHAHGPIATAGGCLAAQYLATWVMLHKAGAAATLAALHELAPVGEQAAYAQKLLGVVAPFMGS